MRIFLKTLLLILLSAQAALAQDKPLIVASINPIYQIILAITKDKSNNVLLVNSSLSEHDYALKTSDAAAVNKADLIFYVSDDLEKSLERLVVSQNKKLQSFELIKIKDLKILQKRNDPNQVDLHIWLNPENAIKIAEFVTQKVSEIDPKNVLEYRANLKKFKKEIVVTNKSIKSELAKIKGSDYVFFHDGYQYFEKYFGLMPLKIIATSHDYELSTKDLKELDVLAKQGRVKCIFGEAHTEKNTAKKLAKKYKTEFATLDLIGEDKDYSALLLKISSEIFSCSN